MACRAAAEASRGFSYHGELGILRLQRFGGVVGMSSSAGDCAICCRPPGFRRPWPGIPQPEDSVWLVWRALRSSKTVMLLGGGLVERAPRNLFGTDILWTDRDSPGLYTAAERLGYYGGGKSTMAFLRLRDVILPIHDASIQGLTDMDGGLNIALPSHASILSGALPMM